MPDQISSCPFCNSLDVSPVTCGIFAHAVLCNSCGAAGPMKPSRDEAIAAWNARILDINIMHAHLKAIRGAIPVWNPMVPAPIDWKDQFVYIIAEVKAALEDLESKEEQ